MNIFFKSAVKTKSYAVVYEDVGLFQRHKKTPQSDEAL